MSYRAAKTLRVSLIAAIIIVTLILSIMTLAQSSANTTGSTYLQDQQNYTYAPLQSYAQQPQYLTDPQEEITFNINAPFTINIPGVISASSTLSITYSPVIEIPSGVIFPNQTENLGITLSGSQMQISVSIPSITIMGVGINGGTFSNNINALGTYSVSLASLTAVATGVPIPLYMDYTTYVSGVLTVTGDVANPINEQITFNQPTTIPITITAENVPNGTITITLSDISYTIEISALYLDIPLVGKINLISSPITLTNIEGQPNSISSTIIIKPYLVTFIEQGLPSGTAWSVTLNGVTKTSTTNEVTFEVPAGTFSYTVGSVPGYTASPSSGSVTVTNSNVTQTISFEQIQITPPVTVTHVNTQSTSTSSMGGIYTTIISLEIIALAIIIAAVIIIKGMRRRG
ncbi:hypothetical protein [Vulcanisaeta sp. JCM 14467]|uniref:hypothetical protein n=1 Tax=Vulcanisaeta sp. JCM 14467 TaxID=1295370 RepID=UPI0006D0556C|nr:hypothetical protein [Vulcanisaeta sp. JCM 14467]